MKRYIDLSVTVDDTTLSPPSTNMKLDITPHRRGPGFWQVSSVHQSLHTGAHIDSPLHVFKDGITTAEIALDQVIGEALVVDLSFAGANHKVTIDDPEYYTRSWTVTTSATYHPNDRLKEHICQEEIAK